MTLGPLSPKPLDCAKQADLSPSFTIKQAAQMRSGKVCPCTAASAAPVDCVKTKPKKTLSFKMIKASTIVRHCSRKTFLMRAHSTLFCLFIARLLGGWPGSGSVKAALFALAVLLCVLTPTPARAEMANFQRQNTIVAIKMMALSPAKTTSQTYQATNASGPEGRQTFPSL